MIVDMASLLFSLQVIVKFIYLVVEGHQNLLCMLKPLLVSQLTVNSVVSVNIEAKQAVCFKLNLCRAYLQHKLRVRTPILQVGLKVGSSRGKMVRHFSFFLWLLHIIAFYGYFTSLHFMALKHILCNMMLTFMQQHLCSAVFHASLYHISWFL